MWLEVALLGVLAVAPQDGAPFAFPDGFLADHRIPAEFADPDPTQGIAKAKAIYADFLLHGTPVDPAVVALNYPTTSSNQVGLTVGVEPSWGAILTSIRQARQSIDITMIGWQVDELVPFHRPEKFGFELIDELCGAARRGVSVNVAVNDMWFKQKAWYLTGGFDRHFDNAIKHGRCQDPGGKKLRYVRGIAWKRKGDHVIGRYDHRKVWIIDGEVAYIGGYTVSDEMRQNMFDALWVLRGPVVAQLQANFLLSMGYARAPLADFSACRSDLKRQRGCSAISPELFAQVVSRYFPEPPRDDPSYSKPLTIVQNNALVPDPRALGVTRLYRHLIASAREHLQVAVPFFTEDRIVDAILDRYRVSDCRVALDVLFPKRPEHMPTPLPPLQNITNRLITETHAIRAQSCGGEGAPVVARVFRGDGACSDFGKRGRLHGKVLLSDDWVSIGSANLDGISLERDIELNVVSDDRGLIERVSREFFGLGGSDRCGEAFPFEPSSGGRPAGWQLAQFRAVLPVAPAAVRWPAAAGPVPLLECRSPFLPALQDRASNVSR